MVSKMGDHFVLRFYSPLETIGGGMILDPNPIKHRRFKEETIEELKIKEEGSSEDVIERVIKRFSNTLETTGFYAKQTGLGEAAIEKLIGPLLEQKVITKFLNNILIHYTFIDEVEESIITIINKYHQSNPLRQGISKEELRNKVLSNAKIKLFDEFVEYYISLGTIKQVNKSIALKSFHVEFSAEHKKIYDELISSFISGGFQPPSIEELVKNVKNPKNHQQVLHALIESGELIKINDDFYLHSDYYKKAIELIRQFIEENKEISLGEFRDLLNTTRKYALPLLEYFDQNKVTKRLGEKRILY